MKYLFIILFFCVATITSPHVYAGGAVGGGATEITQALNFGELVPVNISDAATAISTHGSFIKSVILDPIANQLISGALQGSANDIFSWVAGGFDGQPLIISDPKQAIENAGLSQVKSALAEIPTGDFGDSLFSSVLSQYQGANDIAGQLKALSKSDMPSLLQQGICSDDALTKFSLPAVEESDGSYSDADLAAKKTELYNYACVGDPNTDEALATKLQDLSTQNPEVASEATGWDGWLCLTESNCNEAKKAPVAETLIADAAQNAEKLKEEDIFQGAGPVSQTECDEYADVTEEGQDPVCLHESTVTPGDTIAAALDKATTAGMDRLSSLMGADSLSGLIESLATSVIQGVASKAVGSVFGGGGGSIANKPVVLNSKRPVLQDLTNDPLQRTQVTKPMNKQLKYYSDMLDSLATLDSQYTNDLNAYQARIDTVKTCTSAAGYYNDRNGRISTLRASLVAEQSKITQARTLISDTQTKMSASNSSDEELAIFNAFMQSVDDGSLPNNQAEGARRIEGDKNKRDAANDTELTTWQNTCAQELLLQQQQAQQQNGAVPVIEAPGGGGQ